jgi:hypothetical protein
VASPTLGHIVLVARFDDQCMGNVALVQLDLGGALYPCHMRIMGVAQFRQHPNQGRVLSHVQHQCAAWRDCGCKHIRRQRRPVVQSRQPPTLLDTGYIGALVNLSQGLLQMEKPLQGCPMEFDGLGTNQHIHKGISRSRQQAFRI